MVAESVGAKIFKIGSVVLEIWPFYHITLWSAIVGITKNEHDETTYTKVWNAETASVGTRGLKSRMCPPYPHACRKRRLKWGAVI